MRVLINSVVWLNYLIIIMKILEDLEEQLSQCKDLSPGLDEFTVPMLEHLLTLIKFKLLNSLNQQSTRELLPHIINKLHLQTI